jgi:hypothetical protein
MVHVEPAWAICCRNCNSAATSKISAATQSSVSKIITNKKIQPGLHPAAQRDQLPQLPPGCRPVPPTPSPCSKMTSATMVGLKKEEADLAGYEQHPYNALLDNFEKGCTIALLDKVFAAVRGPLKDLLDKIAARPPSTIASCAAITPANNNGISAWTHPPAGLRF